MAFHQQAFQFGQRTILGKASRVIPWLGAAIALAGVASAIRRKGLIHGTLDSGLNALPVVGGVKACYEIARGRELFPDRRSGVASMRTMQAVRRSCDTMARGWESLSVEAQQADAIDRRPSGPAMTPAVAVRQSERNMLMLARSRAQSDLQLACVPAHRAMLEQAIADLDSRLAALTGTPRSGVRS